MPSYKIERWDPVIPTGHTQPLPMIYIKADETLVKLAEDNFYTVIVEISGTGKLYDTKPMVGIIDSSGYYPQFRPNFFNDKKLLVITLMCDWIGYGDLGAACIHGFTGPDKVKFEPKKFEAPKPLPTYETYKKCRKNNLSNRQIALILGVIIFILFGIVLIKVLKFNDFS